MKWQNLEKKYSLDSLFLIPIPFYSEVFKAVCNILDLERFYTMLLRTASVQTDKKLKRIFGF